MNINDFYPSRYLSAADLQGQPVRVRIEAISKEMVGAGPDAQMKPILRFAGKQKQLVLNKTNFQTIAAQHGDETTGWIGRDIVLKPTTTTFQGKVVPAVRVDTFTPPEPRRGDFTAAPPPAPAPDDEIPW